MTAEELKIWRTEMGYTHRAAAAALGIALNTYQELERGFRFRNSAPAPIDRRTELACRYLQLTRDLAVK